MEQVKSNFEKYCLPDNRAISIQGWLKNSLTKADIAKLSLAKLQAAVDDYRKKNNISDPIIQIDWNAAYWKKSKEF